MSTTDETDAEVAIAALLAQTGRRDEDEAWMDDVLAEIDEHASEEDESPSSPWLGVVLTMAAAAVLVLALPTSRPTGELDTRADRVPEGIEWRPLGTSAELRGRDLHPGDSVTLRGPATSAFAELRVYRDGRTLVLRCPGASACTRGPSEIGATLRLEARGRYQALVLDGATALPEPADSLDDDAAAAAASGAKIILGDPLDVR